MNRSAVDFAIVFTDGGARPTNPGHAAFGVVVTFPNSNRDDEELSRYIGRMRTNNDAEWLGLIVGISYAYFLGARSIELRCDSQLICRQAKGEYRAKDFRMQGYQRQAQDSLEKLYGEGNWKIVNIKRDNNHRADELATAAAFWGMGRNPFLTPKMQARYRQKGKVVDPFRLGPAWATT